MGSPDFYGWRSITHPQSGGLFLTVTKQGRSNVLLVRDKGTIFCWYNKELDSTGCLTTDCCFYLDYGNNTIRNKRL